MDGEDDVQSPDETLVVDEEESKNSSDAGNSRKKRGRPKKKPSANGDGDIAVEDGKPKVNRRYARQILI